MFELINEHNGARLGKLKTSHGIIQTPFFMPVATKAAVKHVSNEELKKAGTEAIISNSFVLYLKPGLDHIKQGLHKFMNWDRVIFTDSGGFQMLSEDFLIKADDHGVTFRSPFDGQKHLLTPEDVIKIEQHLKADVIMALDDVPHYGNSKKYIAESLKRTHYWAERCKESHTSKQLLFGIAQGGTFRDLREKSIRTLNELDLDGVALGGLCIGESKDKMFDMVKLSNKLIPKDKPRYLMGVGSPEDIVQSVENGVDIFDSCFPTRNARHNHLFTSKGHIKISNRQYRDDQKPIDKACDCYVCKNFTRAYIHYLMKVREPNGLHYASYHNVYFVQDLIKNIRLTIKEDSFKQFKKGFLGKYTKH